MRPQLHTARELGETLLRQAHRPTTPRSQSSATYPRVDAVLPQGVAGCPPALEEGRARYTPEQRHALVFRMGEIRALAATSMRR